MNDDHRTRECNSCTPDGNCWITYESPPDAPPDQQFSSTGRWRHRFCHECRRDLWVGQRSEFVEWKKNDPDGFAAMIKHEARFYGQDPESFEKSLIANGE